MNKICAVYAKKCFTLVLFLLCSMSFESSNAMQLDKQQAMEDAEKMLKATRSDIAKEKSEAEKHGMWSASQEKAAQEEIAKAEAAVEEAAQKLVGLGKSTEEASKTTSVTKPQAPARPLTKSPARSSSISTLTRYSVRAIPPKIQETPEEKRAREEQEITDLERSLKLAELRQQAAEKLFTSAKSNLNAALQAKRPEVARAVIGGIKDKLNDPANKYLDPTTKKLLDDQLTELERKLASGEKIDWKKLVQNEGMKVLENLAKDEKAQAFAKEKAQSLLFKMLGKPVKGVTGISGKTQILGAGIGGVATIGTLGATGTLTDGEQQHPGQAPGAQPQSGVLALTDNSSTSTSNQVQEAAVETTAEEKKPADDLTPTLNDFIDDFALVSTMTADDFTSMNSSLNSIADAITSAVQASISNAVQAVTKDTPFDVITVGDDAIQDTAASCTDLRNFVVELAKHLFKTRKDSSPADALQAVSATMNGVITSLNEDFTKLLVGKMPVDIASKVEGVAPDAINQIAGRVNTAIQSALNKAATTIANLQVTKNADKASAE